MYHCLNKAEVIAKIWRPVKLHLLMMRTSSEIFPVIGESFAKYHSLSPKWKQNREKKNCYSFGQCSNTHILHRKYSNIMTDVEAKESEQNYEECFKEIANGNPDIEKQLKVIEFEINVSREFNRRIPKIIQKDHWEKMLTLSRRQREKYLSFLRRNEYLKRVEPLKHKAKVENRSALRKEKEEEQNMSYGIANNSLFLRIYEQSINRLKNLKLLTANYYSQHLILDCSYEKYMSDVNQKFCAKQMLTMYRDNRNHLSPFHLKFCNVNKKDGSMAYLSQLLKADSKELSNYLDVTSQSYLDLYPKEKLVYLTPHCKEFLDEYNEDDIYIIGAFVDRGCGGQYSLGKAKENNLRMAKLPLDKYLIWGKGNKSLPLNIILNILADVRLYRNWNRALEHVPRRFLER